MKTNYEHFKREFSFWIVNIIVHCQDPKTA